MSPCPLLDLPIELLEIIIAEVSPDDIVNFAMCCRLLQRLTEDRRYEHLRLLQCYSAVTVGPNTSCPKPYAAVCPRPYAGPICERDALMPTNLLVDIILDPRVACYVRTLQIQAETLVRRGEQWTEGEDLQSLMSIRESLGATLVSLVEDSKYIRTEEQRLLWSQTIHEGSDAPVIALCLTLLPNLTAIEFYAACDFQYVQSIIEGITDISRVSTKPHALSKLQSVSILGDGKEDCSDLDFLHSCVGLPSVGKLFYQVKRNWRCSIRRDRIEWQDQYE